MTRVERDGEVFEIRERIPLLPLRDVVIYPYMTIPLLVGRVASVNAIENISDIVESITLKHA